MGWAAGCRRPSERFHAISSPGEVDVGSDVDFGPVSMEGLRELAANSVEASFLAPERKLALLAEVERYGG